MEDILLVRQLERKKATIVVSKTTINVDILLFRQPERKKPTIMKKAKLWKRFAIPPAGTKNTTTTR